jgi:hypothetical protein
MALSKEMRLLQNRWQSGSGTWPRHLEWPEIHGLRGCNGQRIDFNFPMVAIVGENGAGKSTVLQCAAASHRSGATKPRAKYASDFFPDTAWEKIQKATVRWSIREGQTSHTGSIRKITERWRGNPQRRERNVQYIDLSRILPVAYRLGYSRLAKPQYKEASFLSFEPDKLGPGVPQDNKL